MRLKEPVHSNNSKIQESAFDAKTIESALGAKALDYKREHPIFANVLLESKNRA